MNESVKALESALPARRVVAYASGDFALNLAWQMTGIFSLIYLTDVYRLSAASAGAIFLVSRVVDAVCDPLIGWISDHTKTKAGSYRPYLLLGSIPLGVTLILLFWSPDLDSGARVIYAGGIYIAFMISYSLVGTPFGALLPTLTRDQRSRSRLASLRFAFAMFGLVAVAGLTPAVVSAAPTPQIGYRIAAIVFGLALIGVFAICYRGTTEKFRHFDTSQHGTRQSVRAVLGNGPLLIVIAALLFLLGDLTLITGSVTYTYTYRFHAPAAVGLFLIVFALSGAAATFLVPRLRRRFESRTIAMSGLALVGLASLAWLLLPPQPLFSLPIAALDGAGIVATAACVLSMIADAVDYGQAKTGVQAAGLASAAYSLVTKLAAALGGLAIAELLAAAGYMPNVAQSPAVLTTMELTITVLPAISSAAAIVILIFYPLTGHRMQTITSSLSAVRN